MQVIIIRNLFSSIYNVLARTCLCDRNSVALIKTGYCVGSSYQSVICAFRHGAMHGLQNAPICKPYGMLSWYAPIMRQLILLLCEACSGIRPTETLQGNDTARRELPIARGYWRCKCPTMLRRVNWRIFKDVSEKRNVFIFSFKNQPRFLRGWYCAAVKFW
jgi:hypothetical protein